MRKIFYLGYYDLPDGKTDVVLAATNKMNYIVDVLAESGYSVEIISASSNKRGERNVGGTRQIGDNVRLTTFDSNIGKNRFARVVKRRIFFNRLKSYLKKQISEGDTVLIYHSLGYYKLYKWLITQLKANVILEAEEIYTDVGKTRFVTREKEEQALSYANAYIFPTRLLDGKVNKAHKPSVIIHGTYGVEADRKCEFGDIELRKQDKRIIHCVYAGTFDPRKGGAIAAAAAAEFLPENYHIHILGFGSDVEIQNMKDMIADISARSKAKVTYDGLLSGEDYIRFIQSCDIGLSTQNPDAAFNATSFPSKILSYMANGLRVVSIRIPAIEGSAIGDYMYYYDTQTPEAIAKAVMTVDVSDDYDGRKIISQLDSGFRSELLKLLDERA